jgi:hypothetical protein
MTPGPSGSEVDARLLYLLEQLVANQSVHAVANLNDEIAERLDAAARLRSASTNAGGNGSPPGFTDEQQQLVMRFRALRNGLGNLARHADQSTVLMPSPLLDDTGRLNLVDPLPAEAATLRAFDAVGTELDRFTARGGQQVVEGIPPQTASVQVDDARGTALLLGFPHSEPVVIFSRGQS